MAQKRKKRENLERTEAWFRLAFQIPKEYLLYFLVSRYFIGIAVKSEKHKKFNEQLKKLRGELPENRIV